MPESCANCQHSYRLEKWVYVHGCEHTPQEGFVCMAMADEHLAVWMVGTDPHTDKCEMYAGGERNA